VKKLVIFASGSGSNFQAIINATKNQDIHAVIAGLIVNKKNIGAVERAQKHDIPVALLTPDDTHQFEQQLEKQLHKWNPDLIVLAGFLKKIPERIIRKYPDKIINIHPALLPKYGGKGFYGLRVHKAVIEAEESESGCTVHYVNEEYDKGDIIAQKKVPVQPSDTPEILAKRVLKEEHKLLPSVIKNILNQNN